MDDGSARRKHSGFLFGFAATLGVAAAIVTPVVIDSSAAPPGKVTICHRTDSQTNPYVRITISNAAAFNGHFKKHKGDVWFAGHPKEPKWGDIIPPTSYKGQHFRLNWNSAGKAIFHNGCSAAAPVPSSSVPITGSGTA